MLLPFLFKNKLILDCNLKKYGQNFWLEVITFLFLLTERKYVLSFPQ